MRKLAIIDKNLLAGQSQWKAAARPKKYFFKDNPLISDIDNYKPDFVFANKGNTFTNLPAVLRKYKSVYFYGDFYSPIPPYVFEFASCCNAVALTNKESAIWKQIRQLSGQKNIFFTSMGTDTEIFKPIPKTKKKYDIVFAGNYFGPKFLGSDLRLTLVRSLLNKGYNLQVIGNGWPEDIGALPRQNHHDLNKSINQAKITVGISHFIDINYYTSNRIYQCMATGVPHICWHSPNVDKIFKAGYLYVSSYPELYDKLDYFLNSQSTRYLCGKLQRSEIVERHTIKDSWAQIEKIFKKI